MKTIELIAYIILSLNFGYRLFVGVYVLIKYSDEKIFEISGNNFRRKDYYYGIVENLLLLILTNLLYF